MRNTSAIPYSVVGTDTQAPSASPVAGAPGVYSFRAGATTITIAGSIPAVTDTLPQAISENWGRILRARLSDEMQSRLIRVASQRRRSDVRPLTTQSLGDFLKFWSQVRLTAVEPEITVAPDGTLSAEWFKSAQQKLDVRFVYGRAVFGLFSRRGILEGSESIENVAKYLKTHSAKPLQWSV
jgi:hypothetical protein